MPWLDWVLVVNEMFKNSANKRKNSKLHQRIGRNFCLKDEPHCENSNRAEIS